MIERRIISSCWYQSLKFHRADSIWWTDKSQFSCLQCDSSTFYVTQYFVFYSRFIRSLHIILQTLIMSRNIVKFMMQMSHCSKYSLESVFSNVTAAIVDVKALRFAVSSECHEVIFHSLNQSILNFRFVFISNVFECSSWYSQFSLLSLFLTLFASAFLIRSNHILHVYHENHSNLCYHCRRCLSSFDVHERFFIHSASSSIAQHYHISISHLFTCCATSSTFEIVKFCWHSASALVYITQRFLRHLSHDFLRQSERQSRNSFDNQHDVTFLWSSSELLSEFVRSVTVQLLMNSSLCEDNVFCTHHVAHIRRCSSRFYVFLTRAWESLFAHRKLHDHFRRHITHELTEYSFS